MGCGCNYRLKHRPDLLAFWIPVDLEEGWEEEALNWQLENIKTAIEELPKAHKRLGSDLYYGAWYKLNFESTHNGDIKIDLLLAQVNGWDISRAEANLGKAYDKIIKHLNKTHVVCCAGGSWCYYEYKVGEYK